MLANIPMQVPQRGLRQACTPPAKSTQEAPLVLPQCRQVLPVAPARPRHGVGQRVLYENQGTFEPGVVRFLGITQFADGEWVGVELDRGVGRNDGSVRGVSYFTCAPRHGVFCRASRILAQAAPPRTNLRQPRMRRLASESAELFGKDLTPPSSFNSALGGAAGARPGGGCPLGAPHRGRGVRRSAPPPRAGAVQATTPPPSRDALARLWSLADADGDGVLSLGEFGRLLTVVAEDVEEHTIATTFHGLRRAYDQTLAAVVGPQALPQGSQGLDFALYRELLCSAQGLQVSHAKVVSAISKLEGEVCCQTASASSATAPPYSAPASPQASEGGRGPPSPAGLSASLCASTGSAGVGIGGLLRDLSDLDDGGLDGEQLPTPPPRGRYGLLQEDDGARTPTPEHRRLPLARPPERMPREEPPRLADLPRFDMGTPPPMFEAGRSSRRPSDCLDVPAAGTRTPTPVPSECGTVVTARTASVERVVAVPRDIGGDADEAVSETFDGDDDCETDEDMPELEVAPNRPHDTEEEEDLFAGRGLDSPQSDNADPESPGLRCGSGDFSKCWGRGDLRGALRGV